MQRSRKTRAGSLPSSTPTLGPLMPSVLLRETASMTPDRHTRYYKATHRWSLVVVFSAFPAFFVSCLLKWELVAQVIVFSFIPLLFLMRYLPTVLWRLVFRPECPECSAVMLVLGRCPIRYKCQNCDHSITTSVRLTHPKHGRGTDSPLVID